MKTLIYCVDLMNVRSKTSVIRSCDFKRKSLSSSHTHILCQKYVYFIPSIYSLHKPLIRNFHLRNLEKQENLGKKVDHEPPIGQIRFQYFHYIRLGYVDQAIKSKETFQLQLSLYQYSELISLLISNGRLDEVRHLIDKEIPETGLKMNFIFYYNFIELLCSNGYVDIALFYVKKKKNFNIKNDVKIAKLLTNRNQLDNLLKWIEYLEEKYHDPLRGMSNPGEFLTVYNLLLQSFFDTERTTEALDLFNKLKIEKKLTPNNTTIDIMLTYSSRKKLFSFGFKLLNEYVECITLETGRKFVCSYISDQIVRSGKVNIEHVLHVFQMNFSCSTRYHYKILIASLCELELFDLLPQVLDEMTKQNYTPTGEIYQIILEAMCDANLEKDSIKIYEHMISQGFVDFKSIMLIMYSCCLRDEIEIAFKFFNEQYIPFFNDDDINEEVKVIERVVRKLCEKRRENLALEFLFFLAEKIGTYVATIESLNSIISSKCKKSSMYEAEQVFSTMISKFGINPNIQTFTLLMEGYAKQSNFEKAMDIMINRLAKYKLKSDYKIRSIFESMQQKFNNEKVIKLHQKLQ